MNYIYDIILNFNKDFFDFYDWNLTDSLTEVRKIPIFRVDNKTYNNLFKSNFKLDSGFVDKINNKCEIYVGKTIKKMTAFLLTNNENIIAFKLDKELQISSLQIDEELDILDELDIDLTCIKYKIINKKTSNLIKTRNQIDNESFIKSNLEKLFAQNNESKIKYIYYECFNKKESRLEIIKRQLNDLSNYSETSYKLYNILMCLNTINN